MSRRTSPKQIATGTEARPHGLPGPLPEGERILWQGSPQWRSLAWRAFHVREVAIWFGALGLWRGVSGWLDTGSALIAAERASFIAPFAIGAAALLALLAYMASRYAVYTLTDRRIVLNIGAALTSTLNLPLKAVVSADLRRHSDATGDIALELGGGARIAFATLWPHARPWNVKRPQPTLRAIAEPDRVASLIAEALSPGAGARVTQSRATAVEAGSHGATPALAN